MEIVGTGVSLDVRTGGFVIATPVIGIRAGIHASAGVNYYIEREKAEMDKQDREENKKRGESK